MISGILKTIYFSFGSENGSAENDVCAEIFQTRQRHSSENKAVFWHSGLPDAPPNHLCARARFRSRLVPWGGWFSSSASGASNWRRVSKTDKSWLEVHIHHLASLAQSERTPLQGAASTNQPADLEDQLFPLQRLGSAAVWKALL